MLVAVATSCSDLDCGLEGPAAQEDQGQENQNQDPSLVDQVVREDLA